MILRELFYASPGSQQVANDMRYNPADDTSAIHRSDTRKTRLTLGQINKLRKSSEAHILEQDAELSFIADMYAAPPAP